MSKNWYQNAIVYALDVATYFDADNNGIGDFRGLSAKLPYLADLGITCLWLLPFYPSHDLDNGYAITNYFGVDNGVGTPDEFREFVCQAHQHDIRVIIDLVVNHTSDQHHWFQDTLNDPDSPFRHYYIWSREKPADLAPKVVFPGEQKANWTYHEIAEAYYWHYYYDFQPGLNYANPEVWRESIRIIEFWLKFGIDGFRVDSIPMLISEKGLPQTKPEHGHQVLKHLNTAMKMHNPEAIFLAEANVPPKEMLPYFGNGDEMDMLFNFYFNSRFFLALARQNAKVLKETRAEFLAMLKHGHWLNFVRTLDELSVERLTEAEQEEVFQHFAPEETMQIFGRGIRRRLPPMLQNDRRLIELTYSLCFSLPGTQMLVYGEEIGMGDKLKLKGRMSIRTPMQWRNTKNGGFSEAESNRLARPLIDSGCYSYENINVEDQANEADSLLNWMKTLIQVRKSYPILGAINPEIYETEPESIFALHNKGEKQELLTIHNLSEQAVSIDIGNKDWEVIVADKNSQKSGHLRNTIELSLYGY